MSVGGNAEWMEYSNRKMFIPLIWVDVAVVLAASAIRSIYCVSVLKNRRQERKHLTEKWRRNQQK